MEFVDWHVEFVDCNLQTNEMGGKSKKGAFKEDLRNIKGNMKETEGTSQEHKRIKVQTNETQGTSNEEFRFLIYVFYFHLLSFIIITIIIIASQPKLDPGTSSKVDVLASRTYCCRTKVRNFF